MVCESVTIQPTLQTEPDLTFVQINPYAPKNFTTQISQVYVSHEQENYLEYDQLFLEVEITSFIQMIIWFSWAEQQQLYFLYSSYSDDRGKARSTLLHHYELVKNATTILFIKLSSHVLARQLHHKKNYPWLNSDLITAENKCEVC